MATTKDSRPLVKIFLAAGQEFEAARKDYESLVGRLGSLPILARRFRLEALHWQQGGGVVGSQSVQKLIEASVQMHTVPIVLLLIGTHVGPGTREEYETALSLRHTQGSWPQVFAYFRCEQDGVTLLGGDEVRAFHQRLIEDKISVPSHFRDLRELEERFGEQLVELLVPMHQSDPLAGEVLRERFLWCAALTFFVAGAAIFVSSTMAFPSNAVSWTKVFIILAAPPIIFLLGIATIWLFSRLIREFHFAWNSVSYSDDRLFKVFKNLVPSALVPHRIRSTFPSSRIGNALNVLLLSVAFATPIVAQYACIFHEIVKWDYVVDPNELIAPPSLTECRDRTLMQSRFVERGPLQFPYALRTPDVVQRHAGKRSVIHVYAAGTMGEGRHFWTENAFRENMGPGSVPALSAADLHGAASITR